jgi:hypothetical protein
VAWVHVGHLPGEPEGVLENENMRMRSIVISIKLKPIDGKEERRAVLLAPVGLLKNTTNIDEGDELSLSYGPNYWSNFKFTTRTSTRHSKVRSMNALNHILKLQGEYAHALKAIKIAEYPHVKSKKMSKARIQRCHDERGGRALTKKKREGAEKKRKSALLQAEEDQDSYDDDDDPTLNAKYAAVIGKLKKLKVPLHVYESIIKT